MTRFEFPRHNLSIRVSTDLDKEIERCAEALGASKTDVCVYALCLMLDPTGKVAPDVKRLPEDLRQDFAPTPSASKLAEHFFKSDSTDWASELGEDLKCP